MLKRQTHWDIDGYLVLLLKCVEVLLSGGRVEIIYRPQRKHNELPKSIKTYDGLNGGFTKLEAQVEALKEILKDKEREISEVKIQLRQANEDAIKEYHDFNAFLKELGGSFADEFDDYFRQVKASFPNLDLSHISIDAQAQTPAQPFFSEGIDKLFADETNPDPQGDGDAAQVDQEKFVEDVSRQLEGDQTMEENNEETPAVQQQFFLFYL